MANPNICHVTNGGDTIKVVFDRRPIREYTGRLREAGFRYQGAPTFHWEADANPNTKEAAELVKSDNNSYWAARQAREAKEEVAEAKPKPEPKRTENPGSRKAEKVTLEILETLLERVAERTAEKVLAKLGLD